VTWLLLQQTSQVTTTSRASHPHRRHDGQAFKSGWHLVRRKPEAPSSHQAVDSGVRHHRGRPYRITTPTRTYQFAPRSEPCRCLRGRVAPMRHRQHQQPSRGRAGGPKSRESGRTVGVRSGACAEPRDDLSPARQHAPGPAEALGGTSPLSAMFRDWLHHGGHDGNASTTSVVSRHSAERFLSGGAAHDRGIRYAVVRRDGGQKTAWTEPLHRRSAMGIECPASDTRR
jgi:hypothetical protein